MNLLFWGLTIGVVGKALLATGVIVSHLKLAREQKIDQEVLKGLRLELILAVIGLILIIVGYGLEVYFYGFTPLLTCEAENCAAALMFSR